jgi:hypothetical protein
VRLCDISPGGKGNEHVESAGDDAMADVGIRDFYRAMKMTLHLRLSRASPFMPCHEVMAFLVGWANNGRYVIFRNVMISALAGEYLIRDVLICVFPGRGRRLC